MTVGKITLTCEWFRLKFDLFSDHWNLAKYSYLNNLVYFYKIYVGTSIMLRCSIHCFIDEKAEALKIEWRLMPKMALIYFFVRIYITTERKRWNGRRQFNLNIYLIDWINQELPFLSCTSPLNCQRIFHLLYYAKKVYGHCENFSRTNLWFFVVSLIPKLISQIIQFIARLCINFGLKRPSWNCRIIKLITYLRCWLKLWFCFVTKKCRWNWRME